jgi:hypothetical protein
METHSTHMPRFRRSVCCGAAVVGSEADPYCLLCYGPLREPRRNANGTICLTDLGSRAVPYVASTATTGLPFAALVRRAVRRLRVGQLARLNDTIWLRTDARREGAALLRCEEPGTENPSPPTGAAPRCPRTQEGDHGE